MSRRELGGPPPEPGSVEVPVEHGHAHREPRTAVRSLTVAVIGLIVVAVLLGWYAVKTEGRAIDAETQAAQVEERLEALEAFVEDRGEQRDDERAAVEAQAAEDRERFRANLCEVLGELSATAPNLERLREALGCRQPGTAPASRDDDVGPGPAPPDPQPPPGSARQPAPPAPAPAEPTPPPTGGASRSDQPTEPSDPALGPLGELLCSLPLLC